MSDFLMTILVIIVIFYLIRIVFRFLFPILLRYWMNKMTGGQLNEMYKQQKEASRRKEGDMHVEDKRSTRTSRPATSTEGDYVDYEEVK